MENKRRGSLKETKKQEQVKKEIKLDYGHIAILAGGALGVVLLIVVLSLTFTSKGLNNKKVSDTKLKVEDTNLTFANGVTNVKATVKNKGKKEYTNLSLRMVFLDNKGNEITSMRGYVGDIKKGETGNINAAITKDITKAKDVKFTIAE